MKIYIKDCVLFVTIVLIFLLNQKGSCGMWLPLLGGVLLFGVSKIPVAYVKVMAPVLLILTIIYLLVSVFLPEGYCSLYLPSFTLTVVIPQILCADRLSVFKRNLIAAGVAVLILTLMCYISFAFAMSVCVTLCLGLYLSGKKQILWVWGALLVVWVCALALFTGESDGVGVFQSTSHNSLSISSLLAVAQASLVVIISVNALKNASEYKKHMGILASCIIVAFTLDSAMRDSIVVEATMLSISILSGIVVRCLSDATQDINT